MQMREDFRGDFELIRIWTERIRIKKWDIDKDNEERKALPIT